MRRALTAAAAFAIAVTAAAQTTPAPAPAPAPAAAPQPNTVACPKSGGELIRIPELSSKGSGILKGTLYTVSEQQRMFSTTSGVCYPQWVRAYRTAAPPDNPPNSQLIDPLPGPTLRARVGELVELSFLNLVDPGKFPNADRPCDKNNVYPGNPPFDTPPDCFSESVMTNMHYHGTHTSPGSTADNVFINIRPAPRALGTRAPGVTAASVSGPFTEFFDRCTEEYKGVTGPKQWPRFWDDLPQTLRDMMQSLLEKNAPDWWAIDARQIKQGAWPQYYVGAYPYCFKLPEYTQKTWPPDTRASELSPKTAGMGMAEMDEAADPHRPLIMGQSPGTHWYHAHKHGSTTINVMNGMTGVFVIEGGYDDAFNKVYGDGWTQKQPVIVINQLGSFPNLETPGRGRGPLTVNGRVTPYIKMKRGEVQLWRIANTAWRTGLMFSAPSGMSWRQTAQDGVQFTQENYGAATNLNRQFMVAPGNRADVLVQVPANAAVGTTYQVQAQQFVDPTSLGTAGTIWTVLVSDDPPVNMSLLTQTEFATMPPFLTGITDTEVKGTKVLEFATTTPQTSPPLPASDVPKAPNNVAQHTIDGKKFNGDVGAVVGLNQVEEWKIANFSFDPAIAHPFHIHINPFQITAIFEPNAKLADGTTPRYVFSADPNAPLATGQCRVDPTNASTVARTSDACATIVPPAQRIWWDVFPIPSGKIVNNVQIPGFFRMRSRFVDYAGFFVSHCHILAHEDRGMMTVVEVAPLQTPYSHH